MSWYVDDLRRHRDERLAIEKLSIEANWLKVIGWRFDESYRLNFDADIVTAVRTWPITLQYPAHFPHHPPLVLPRGETERWSGHQWGADGELCLQYGPDNWLPEITGAMMLESAYSLLDGENPADGSKGKVATRHDMTLGQELRSSYWRLLVTPDLKDFFESVPELKQMLGHLLVRYSEDCTVHLLHAAGPKDKPVWRDIGISPHLVRESFEREATIIRLTPTDALPPTGSVDHFCDPLIARGFTLDPDVTFLLRGDQIYGYLFFKDKVLPIDILPPQPVLRRLDEEHDALKQKRVAIVGCGSLGSKVATMLARSGVASFLLVDDDVLFSENLVRNDLDVRDVGLHKVDALTRRLSYVNPSAKVTTRKHRFGGQGSSSAVDTLLTQFEGVDLIVDATANPAVFNVLSAIPKIPLVWGEIFGGGFGGLIARYRPGIEPTPQYIRLAIENWFREYGPGKPTPAVDYGGRRGDGPPMIADDADVSVIAAHTARYTIDLLINRNPSIFEASAYAIGMATENVFSGPFDTFPIGVGEPLAEAPVHPLSQDEATAEITKIVELAVNHAAQAKTPAKNNK